jgi:hypothetical protein
MGSGRRVGRRLPTGSAVRHSRQEAGPGPLSAKSERERGWHTPGDSPRSFGRHDYALALRHQFTDSRQPFVVSEYSRRQLGVRLAGRTIGDDRPVRPQCAVAGGRRATGLFRQPWPRHAPLGRPLIGPIVVPAIPWRESQTETRPRRGSLEHVADSHRCHSLRIRRVRTPVRAAIARPAGQFFFVLSWQVLPH